MNNTNSSSRAINLAKMLKGRFLDRRMNAWMGNSYRKIYPKMQLDSIVSGSGKMRPDVYIPDIGGQSVIFDFGGPSKLKSISKYNGLADEVIPIVPDIFK